MGICQPITLSTSSRLEQRVMGEIDHTHSAAAEFALDHVIRVVREALWKAARFRRLEELSGSPGQAIRHAERIVTGGAVSSRASSVAS